jgi:hypothetical protein
MKDGIDAEEIELQKKMRKKTLFTSLKLNYLDRLNVLLDSGGLTTENRKAVNHRIQRVCHSIESDLNLLGGDSIEHNTNQQSNASHL